MRLLAKFFRFFVRLRTRRVLTRLRPQPTKKQKISLNIRLLVTRFVGNAGLVNPSFRSSTRLFFRVAENQLNKELQ